MESLHAFDATSKELPDHGKRYAPCRPSRGTACQNIWRLSPKKDVEPVPNQENQNSWTDTRIPEPTPGFMTLDLDQERYLSKRNGTFPGLGRGSWYIHVYFYCMEVLYKCVCVSAQVSEKEQIQRWNFVTTRPWGGLFFSAQTESCSSCQGQLTHSDPRWMAMICLQVNLHVM